ncbi:MAG: SPOR domain-containing protein [Candidatus Pedobacter colombiensis]|uniref:SPOR domain-containing protein n=1 Tax=Candidatus Pedobacter colombiensis TaxID=3121371 RepID=A0AAJ5W943_9SPHI|nr:SPOR domain-containing protein [Pedobacter sp.]WEK20302.1 MAG: SPOR domain-containing protein [Pedobacter sp.]
MDILSYLTTLIKTHKEVGIPGLGTIYKRKSPGRYDIDTHSFLPPSYTLSFTSDLKEQTLLTDLISKKKNISVDAATYFVEQFSQNILDELSGHQESDFGDLGTFSTTMGSLTFIPKQESNLGFDFYGLPTVKADLSSKEEESLQAAELPEKEEQPHVPEAQLALENNNADLSDGAPEAEDQPLTDDVLISHLESTELPEQQQEVEHDEQPVYEEIAEVVPGPQVEEEKPPVVIETPEVVKAIDVKEPVPALEKTQQKGSTHFELDYTDPEKLGVPAYLKVIIALVGIIVLAGIIYLAKPELFDSIIKKTSPPPVVQTDTVPAINDNKQIKIDSIAQADSIRKSNEKAILAVDSAKKDSVIATRKPVEKQETVSYEIIAASLLNQKEADNFLADMKRKGIKAKVADMPGKRVKISIGSFTDEESAKKELEVLKKTTKIPGIYIYTVRHTNNPK